MTAMNTEEASLSIDYLFDFDAWLISNNLNV